MTHEERVFTESMDHGSHKVVFLFLFFADFDAALVAPCWLSEKNVALRLIYIGFTF